MIIEIKHILLCFAKSFNPFRFKIIGLLCFYVSFLQAQEKQSWAKENIQFSGYVKYLNITTFQDLDAMLNDNLLHNRLNLKVYLNNEITTALEIRNRVFWGNTIQSIPNYASFIDLNNQDIDLNVDLIDKNAFLIHSEIDRLYVDYRTDKWQVTLGRQRINWGKNLAWNPNDLFNTYNFFDFDYEERPGVDALRLQYFISGNSSIETAINYTNKWKENTFAVKYNFHQFDYDFQVLAAKYLEDYTVGIGWEGAIKNVGIKGEFSYFSPQERTTVSNDIFVGSVSLDYYFKNGISMNAATLYNSGGIKNSNFFDPSQFNSVELNAKNLMPNRWSYFLQASNSMTPAINISLSTIYAYELKGIFVMPQFSYSISQNWDLDIIAQIFYGKEDENFSNIQNSIFLRFRWSY